MDGIVLIAGPPKNNRRFCTAQSEAIVSHVKPFFQLIVVRVM